MTDWQAHDAEWRQRNLALLQRATDTSLSEPQRLLLCWGFGREEEARLAEKLWRLEREERETKQVSEEG